MPSITLLLILNHLIGKEILTKHKKSIYQFYRFAKILIKRLIKQYKLGKLTIIKILKYNTLKRTRISQTKRLIIFTNT